MVHPLSRLGLSVLSARMVHLQMGQGMMEVSYNG